MTGIEIPIKFEITEKETSEKKRAAKKTKEQREAEKAEKLRIREEAKRQKALAREEKKILREMIKAERAAEKQKQKNLKKPGVPLVSSSQPIPTLPDQVLRGGIAGADYELEPKELDFQQAKAIRGGVKRYRDDRSKSAHSAERYIHEQQRLKNDVKANTLNLRAMRKVFAGVDAQVQRIQPIATNPVGYIGNHVFQMLSGVGPYGALAAAAITTIVTSPEVIKEIIHAVSQKGLPLNRDWQRLIEEEVNGLFNIEEKKRRLLGLDAYVVTQTDRYSPDIGSNSTNSLENRDEIIISKSIGNAEKAVGVV